MSRSRERAQLEGPLQLLLLGSRPLTAAVTWGTNSSLSRVVAHMCPSIKKISCSKKKKRQRGKEDLSALLLRAILTSSDKLGSKKVGTGTPAGKMRAAGEGVWRQFYPRSQAAPPLKVP